MIQKSQYQLSYSSNTKPAQNSLFENKIIINSIAPRVLDIQFGKEFPQIQKISGYIFITQLLRSNPWIIVTCSFDFLIALWNINTGKYITGYRMAGNLDKITQQHKFGTLIYSCLKDTELRVVQASNGKLISKLNTHCYHNVNGMHLFNNDSSLFIATDVSITNCWDMQTRICTLFCKEPNQLIGWNKGYSFDAIYIKGGFYIFLHDQEYGKEENFNLKIINLKTKISYSLNSLNAPISTLVFNKEGTKFATLTQIEANIYSIQPFKFVSNIQFLKVEYFGVTSNPFLNIFLVYNHTKVLLFNENGELLQQLRVEGWISQCEFNDAGNIIIINQTNGVQIWKQL